MGFSISWLKILSSYNKFWVCLSPESGFLEEKEENKIISYTMLLYLTIVGHCCLL